METRHFRSIRELFEEVVRLGGTLSGEHGIITSKKITWTPPAACQLVPCENQIGA